MKAEDLFAADISGVEAMTRHAMLSIVQFLFEYAVWLDHAPVKALY